MEKLIYIVHYFYDILKQTAIKRKLENQLIKYENNR